jgi:hypothetical protein
MEWSAAFTRLLRLFGVLEHLIAESLWVIRGRIAASLLETPLSMCRSLQNISEVPPQKNSLLWTGIATSR